MLLCWCLIYPIPSVDRSLALVVRMCSHTFSASFTIINSITCHETVSKHVHTNKHIKKWWLVYSAINNWTVYSGTCAHFNLHHPGVVYYIFTFEMRKIVHVIVVNISMQRHPHMSPDVKRYLYFRYTKWLYKRLSTFWSTLPFPWSSKLTVIQGCIKTVYMWYFSRLFLDIVIILISNRVQQPILFSFMLDMVVWVMLPFYCLNESV